MAGGRCAEDAVLADEKLLDAVCCSNFCNLLDNFWVVEPPISSNDQERAFCTFGNGEQNGSNEGFAVVRLLEDCDFLAEPRRAWPSMLLVVDAASETWIVCTFGP